jgi:hypothetical protein
MERVPRGWFVFGQDLADAGDTPLTNPGHPFMISAAFVEPLLRRWFAEEYRRVVPREAMHEPAMHSGALAFMGRRRCEPV